jgi:thioredoxin reductase
MQTDSYDVVILGTGPAGVYVLVMGRRAKSSLYRAHVENYCCLSRVSGEQLLGEGIRQAGSSGARFLHEDVLATSLQEKGFVVETENGRRIETRALLLDDGRRLELSGVFIQTGAKGAVELAATLGVALDDEQFRYIVTDKEQKTNAPGIFAAGDICGPPWQVAKAVGEGCVAGLAAKLAKAGR